MNYIRIFIVLAFLLPQVIYSQKKKTPTLKNELDSVSYSLGVAIGQTLKSAGINNLNYEQFTLAIQNILKNEDLKISQQQTNNIIQAYVMKMREGLSQKNLLEGKKYLAENAKKEGVVSLPSGLQYKILNNGTGVSPTLNDVVTCHYKGTLINGKVFDSSYERGQPAKFPVNGVIQGWTEALQLMKTGSKWILYIPADLAYGEQSPPGIEPNSVLIFEVELLSVEKGDEDNIQFFNQE